MRHLGITLMETSFGLIRKADTTDVCATRYVISHGFGVSMNQGVIAMDDRKEFLTKMYDQMFNDINTHILVIWQSVGVLIGSFAVFALSEKGIIPIDLAISLVIILASWLMAHLYDASYWYNRNLVIIANIERQFLQKDDLRQIHYYFGK